MALAWFLAPSESLGARAFRPASRPEVLLFCLSKREVPKRKDTRLGACWASMPSKFVSWGRAFRQHIGQPLLRCLNSDIHAVACPGEKEPTSMSTPLQACRPHLTAAQGPQVERRAILTRTRCATAQRWREQGSQKQEARLRAGFFTVASGSVRAIMLAPKKSL